MSTGPLPRPDAPRRRSTPWIVLFATAVLPAIALFGVRTWAVAVRAEVVASEANEVVDPPADLGVLTPELTTDIVAFRRVPAILSRHVSIEALAGATSSVLGSLNDRSCGAVSVGGEPVARRNGDIAVIPASNQKLVVAAAALERLGTDFRYTTAVVVAVEPVDGVVDGDLVLVGGGDPLLSSDWYPTSDLERNPVTSPTSLDTLADRVVDTGVVAITGSILGDGSRYDDEFFAPGWGDGVAGLESGPYDALMVNDSRVLGDPQRASDPGEAAAREFARLLGDRGVTIGGPSASGSAPVAGIEIASIDSAPMTDVIAEMLSASDNNTAELLVKELGTLPGAPGTRDAGLAVMSEQFLDWDVDVTSVVLADGSGLSLDNRLTCDALLTVLQRTGFSSAIGQGLPVAGQTGTLRDVFVDHPVAGRLRGKTGTLNNPPFNLDPPAVKALAGYLPVDGGSAVEYVLVLNGPTISDQSEYRPVWSDLADAIDSYPAGPTPGDLGPR